MAPPYVSPLREAQAAETRRRVLDSAARVFATGGYAGTSMTRIAADAGVSVETVKQNGSKPALLLAAFSQAFSGVEDETPLHRRPALDAIRARPDDEFLAGWLEFVADANRRVAGLWPRLLEAALVERLRRVNAKLSSEEIKVCTTHLRLCLFCKIVKRRLIWMLPGIFGFWPNDVRARF